MDEDKFHAHLDVCRQCREEVFNLCPTGLRLLEDAAAAVAADPKLRGLMQWNMMLNREKQ